MSYLALARRLRPRRFDDLVGQDTNSKILRNAVINERVAHAFLFAGSRGVGKTSAARILTRAINCLNPDNGNPCNHCINCNDINENASPDIFEIDAASNRGIDNIRDLRDNVNYVPARCRYKVYIIDEAHMLTLESFNALLKTLEEPPSYVKFIFATTDPHKIPKTIISRCQRFDFLRISVKQIADYLEKIIKDEKLEISRKSLEMIAQNSAGGMRDALTAIDQILSIEDGRVSDKKTAQILGLLDHESRFSFIEALLKKKDKEALLYFQKLQDYGYDVNDILTDLLRSIKTTALIQTLGTNPSLFQDISSDDLEAYDSLSKIVNNDELQQIFQILLQLEERLKVSSYSKICFEMAILQVTSTESLIDLKEIVSEIRIIRDLEFKKKKTGNDINIKTNDPKINNIEEKIGNSNSIISEKKINYYDDSSKNNILSSEKNKLFENDNKNLVKSYQFVVESENNQNVQNTNKFIQSTKTKDIIKETDEFYIESNKVDNIGKIQSSDDLQLETKNSNYLDLVNKKLNNCENEGQVLKKPPETWIEFSNEVSKKSPKLASFVRNAIPQSFAESELTLSFKSGNYASLLDDYGKLLLEKIASDLSGHAIQIVCNSSESNSKEQTIAEYEKVVLENKRKIQRKNAIDSTQVKGILSVFKNSKISTVKLADE